MNRNLINKVLEDENIEQNSFAWQRLWNWADKNNIPVFSPFKVQLLPDCCTQEYYDGLPRYEDELADLDLSGYRLIDLSGDICCFLELTNLNVYNNLLTTLPKEIGNLHNLTFLNLSDNHLTGLPKEIGNLQSLTSLLLWTNQLTSLPNEIGRLTNLTSLSLSNNCLTELPEEICNLINLSSLDFDNDIKLTVNQEVWIKNLKDNGCYIRMEPIVEEKKALVDTETPTIVDDMENVISFSDNVQAWADKDTGLMWEIKTEENVYYKYFWSNEKLERKFHLYSLDDIVVDALSYVLMLNNKCFAGFSDWRLPTKDELSTIITKKKSINNSHIKLPLSKTNSGIYWSSSFYNHNWYKDDYLHVSRTDGFLDDYIHYKGHPTGVMCVRNKIKPDYNLEYIINDEEYYINDEDEDEIPF